MKTIKYTIFVKYADKPDDTAWKEKMSYVVDDSVTEQSHAESIIERFNKSLRPGERPRKLVKIEIEDNDKQIDHQWEKKSLVTQPGGYDIMVCKNCGVTGKRYGLSQSVKIDNNKKGNKTYCKS